MEAFVAEPRPKWVLPALVSVIATVGAISLVQLPIPPGRDQGIFLYHGWGIIEGLMPYRDMWDHKPPGIHYLYAMAVGLFGHKYVAINVLDIFWRLLTVGAIYSLAARLYGRREGFMAAIFYGLWVSATGGGFWWTAQAEGFMVLPLVLSMHYYLRDTMSDHALSGIFMAIAILLKTTAVLMLVFLICFILFTPRKTWEPRPKRGKFLGFIYGLLVVFVPLTLYFALSYAADDFWETVVTFNLYHSGVHKPLGEFFSRSQYLFLFFMPFWLLVFLKGIFDPEERRLRPVLMFTWLAVSVLMVLVQRKYFLYHFFMIIGPGVVLGARGFGVAVDYARGRSVIAPRVVAVLAILLWTGAGAVSLFGKYMHTPRHFRSFEFLSGEIDKWQYFGRFIDPKGDLSLYEDRAVARYVRDRTVPDEKFLVWGFEPLVNFWAVRFAPTRFNSDYPLTFRPQRETTRRLRKKWRAIFMEDIKKTPPTYIAVVHRDCNALENEDSATQLKDFPEFKRFIHEKYFHETTIGDFELYRRK